MICVSIGEKTVESVLKILEQVPFAEIRLDIIDKLDMAGLKKIMTVNKRKIITFRPGKVEEHVRIAFLKAAIELGAEFIDIEIETDGKIIEGLKSLGKKKGTKLIISYHNFKMTPAYSELKNIVNQCKERDADLVKIATLIQEEKDNLSLLKLLDDQKDLLVIGMGALGKISRIAPVLLGSPFTFASFSQGKETAAGQMVHKDMDRILKALQ